MGIYVLARWRPDLAPLASIASTWKERFRSLYSVYGIIILFALVVGGIYGGYFPPPTPARSAPSAPS